MTDCPSSGSWWCWSYLVARTCWLSDRTSRQSWSCRHRVRRCYSKTCWTRCWWWRPLLWRLLSCLHISSWWFSITWLSKIYSLTSTSPVWGGLLLVVSLIFFQTWVRMLGPTACSRMLSEKHAWKDARRRKKNHDCTKTGLGIDLLHNLHLLAILFKTWWITIKTIFQEVMISP